MPDRQPSVPCPACGAGASLLFALWPCGLGRPFKAPTAQLGLPQYDTADSGPPWRHSLAVTALALCPFSTASLMPAPALILPYGRGQSTCTAFNACLSLCMAPAPQLSPAPLSPAALVPSGGLLPMLAPTVEADGHGRLPALASLWNCWPSLALGVNTQLCDNHPHDFQGNRFTKSIWSVIAAVSSMPEC